MTTFEILQGDLRERMQDIPTESVHTCVTSPPYWGLRDYGTAKWEGGDAECDHNPDYKPRSERPNVTGSGIGKGGAHHDAQTLGSVAYKSVCGKCGARRIDNQIGLEATPAEFVQTMVQVFREVWRVLRPDGTLWLNLGDSYAGSGKGGNPDGSPWAGFVGNKRREQQARGAGYNVPQGLKPKDLIGIPWRVAFALQEDGWWLRSAITWCKRAPMPESVTDRPTSATEMIFLLTKQERYFYDADAVREPNSAGSVERFGITEAGQTRAWHTENNKRDSRSDGTKSNEGFRAFVPVGRNSWNYWVLSPEPYAEAHFATFPTEIPRRAILAGTSEHGACAECGAPWRRVVERLSAPPEVFTKRSAPADGFVHSGSSIEGEMRGHGQKLQAWRDANPPLTKGWQPTCKCNTSDVVPCTVLDPFCGAGTTLLVANRLGRRGIGVELNAEYVDMAMRRIINDAPLFNMVEMTA